MASELERLQERKAALDRRIKELRTQESRKKRKEDARRKILIGGAILSAVEKGVISEEHLTRLLDDHITNEKDRRFLGLRVSSGADTI